MRKRPPSSDPAGPPRQRSGRPHDSPLQVRGVPRRKRSCRNRPGERSPSLAVLQDVGDADACRCNNRVKSSQSCDVHRQRSRCLLHVQDADQDSLSSPVPLYLSRDSDAMSNRFMKDLFGEVGWICGSNGLSRIEGETDGPALSGLPHVNSSHDSPDSSFLGRQGCPGMCGHLPVNGLQRSGRAPQTDIRDTPTPDQLPKVAGLADHLWAPTRRNARRASQLF